MKNWLGQEIELDAWVYRGAREGNGSSFKAGKVSKIKDKKVTVRWYAWPNGNALHVTEQYSTGTSDINSLVRLPEETAMMLEITLDTSVEFGRMEPAPNLDAMCADAGVPQRKTSWGGWGYEYNDPKYREVRENYGVIHKEWIAHKNEYINATLVAAGLGEINMLS